MTDRKYECIADTRCQLGEGAVWDADGCRLLWVDIRSAELHRLTWPQRDHKVWTLPLRASALALWGRHILMIGDDEIGRFDEATGRYERLKTIGLPEGHRTNDGGVGPDGCFWFGSMRDAEDEVQGLYYRLSPNLEIHQLPLPPVLVTNTFCFSPDHRWFLTCDSARQRILSAETMGSGDRIGKLTPFADTDGIGYPDGSAMDETGALWTCLWDGSAIVRHAPDGTRLAIYDLPVPRPTSCAFGGENNSTLFVTSARIGLSEEALNKAPLSGGVFAVEARVRGAPMPRFGQSPT